MTFNGERTKMIKETRILFHHGRQFIPDLRKQPVSDLFRGKPVISEMNEEERTEAASLCPVAAISRETGAIDLGRCVFCRECSFHMPGKIRFTNDYRIASNHRSGLVIKPGDSDHLFFDHSQQVDKIRKVFRRALKLRQVSAGGDNSCEMELSATGNVNFDFGRYGIEFVASPRHADGLVITGPVTVNMARALEMTYRALPQPAIIIMAGTDAISGGLFKDSPAIDRSFIDNHRIDLYVPGNPVHPLTYINGLMDLLGIS